MLDISLQVYLQLASRILADTFDLSLGAHSCEYACWAPQFRYGNYFSEAAVLMRLKSLAAVPPTHTDESTQSDDAIVR